MSRPSYLVNYFQFSIHINKYTSLDFSGPQLYKYNEELYIFALVTRKEFCTFRTFLDNMKKKCYVVCIFVLKKYVENRFTFSFKMANSPRFYNSIFNSLRVAWKILDT